MNEVKSGNSASTAPGGARGLPGSGRRAAAAATLVVYGLLLLAAAVIGVRREAGLATAPSWSILHLVAVLGLAIALIRGQGWAWWGALILSVLALAMLAPLLAAIVGGPGVTLLVPRLDLVLVCLEAAALLFLIVLLAQIRREA